MEILISPTKGCWQLKINQLLTIYQGVHITYLFELETSYCNADNCSTEPPITDFYITILQNNFTRLKLKVRMKKRKRPSKQRLYGPKGSIPHLKSISDASRGSNVARTFSVGLTAPSAIQQVSCLKPSFDNHFRGA